MSDNKKQQVLDFTISEMQKIISDINSGKSPTMSKELIKLAETLSAANEKLKRNEISEEDVDLMVNDLVSDIKNEK